MMMKQDIFYVLLKNMFSVVKHELDREQHSLRQMTGRRLLRQSVGEYKSLKNPDNPVIKRGHWTEVPYEEEIKKIEVTKLKKYVEDFRIKNNKSTASNIPSRLYFNQNIRKRVLVYINGQTPEKAKYFNESRFEDLNEAVKNEFMLNKPVKYFFTNQGKLISRFDEIKRDQIICASTGREYIKPKDYNRDIEIKANWIRKRNEGLDPDSFVLHKRSLRKSITVDPFTSSSSSSPNQAFNINNNIKLMAISDNFYDLNN